MEETGLLDEVTIRFFCFYFALTFVVAAEPLESVKRRVSNVHRLVADPHVVVVKQKLQETQTFLTRYKTKQVASCERPSWFQRFVRSDFRLWRQLLHPPAQEAHCLWRCDKVRAGEALGLARAAGRNFRKRCRGCVEQGRGGGQQNLRGAAR